ncbi:MAG: hypothetical protein IJ532_01895 [Alphaproteobacteria bacterium]|nr:hypothetical protein [Alphaproteobacteria bacterium]
MGELRTGCTSFLAFAFLLCLYGIWYIKYWQRKNPWYKQNDDEMRLSPQERAYRRNERRKYDNLPLLIFGGIIAGMMPMVVLVQREVNGSWNMVTDWVYLIPFIGAMLLAFAEIKRK